MMSPQSTTASRDIPDYHEFIRRKSQLGEAHGFEPIWLPDFLFDFQRHLVEWAIRRGRAAIFADCGLGKTAMQLVWAENVVRRTNRPVLILTPLAVGHQTVREASKFGLEAARCLDGKVSGGARILVTNYQRLHYFDPSTFAGVVCDESSILKNFDGQTKASVTEFMRLTPYRLLCTATAAPNDYVELGTSAEALGEMGYQDMITKFFRQQLAARDGLGWGRNKYILRTHAVRDFWRWVCSWARACRRPSDLGFDDSRFLLPELIVRETSIATGKPTPGWLFEVPAYTLAEQREEERRTLEDRCDTVASLVQGDEQAICWCYYNTEGDRLEDLVVDAVQVSGSDPDERKEELFQAFESGQARVMITKPALGGFGLNWQHCHRMTFFPSHSFERYYQAVRRCWRFGQTKPVSVDIVSTPGSAGTMDNLRRKTEAADHMFAQLVELMNDSLGIKKVNPFVKSIGIPHWAISYPTNGGV